MLLSSLRLARLFSVFVVGLVASTHAAHAETLILEEGLDGYSGWDDTSIFSENENSGGGTDGIFSGTNGQFNSRRALLRVDLSNIPAGSTINSVSLELTVMMSGETFGDFDFSLHALTMDWGEGTVVGLSEGGFGDTANSGDATWQSNLHTQSLWTSAGGDYVVSASATASAGLAGTTATWSSAGMVSDVQSWFDNPSSNHGWILISGIEGQFKRVKKFHSSEAAMSRPRLLIDYTPPATTGPRGFVTGIILFFALSICGVILHNNTAHSRRSDADV